MSRISSMIRVKLISCDISVVALLSSYRNKDHLARRSCPLKVSKLDTIMVILPCHFLAALKLVVTCWERADLLAPFFACDVFFFVFLSLFHMVSWVMCGAPEFCLLPYFNHGLCNLPFITAIY